ncbi:putative XK-related protein 6 [Danaus plexippus plexippus]|uniref:XK-related protein n=1 Tax=Danaus plexippus plexippus TaxID=278856 RepID=A0A212FH14_DANPL|nr:putative XK-related protein 6 [Danaus plexippus plexippus]
MAEACRLGTLTNKKTACTQDENYCVFNVLSVFISLVSILADLTTDVLVFAEYCKDGYLYWAFSTMIFILCPNILINIFSLRWYIIDTQVNLRNWITHCCLVGLLERYIIFLQKVFSCKNLESMKTQKLINQRNDLSLLHFLYIFTGTVPQIILQTYSVVMFNGNYHTKVFALVASIASVIWGCVTYIYSITTFTTDNFKWSSIVLKLTWYFGILIGRIAGILLFSIIFGIWALIPLGLHWSAMTFWIITQKTTFCPNKLEETFYNAVMGFVYCFCYINLREGHTRYRLLMFYTLIVTQNFGSLFLYILISDLEIQRRPWSIAATVCVITGTVIGIVAMMLYYRFFHSKGPIPWKNSQDDVELNNKTATQSNDTKNNKIKGLNNVRSFKTYNTAVEAERNDTTSGNQPLAQGDSQNADKKFLLDHWIARSGSPTFTSAPVGNASMDSSIELYTVENTPQTILRENTNNTTNIKPKKKICFPTELNLKLSSLENLESSIDELTKTTLNIQKRRGICSSDELRDDLNNLNLQACNIVNEAFAKSLKNDHSSELSHDTDGSNKKTSSDSIDMDLDLSFSDINSSDINTFNENIVQKLCLSALKNIKVGNQDADIENIQRIALDILKEMYTKKDKVKNGITTDLFQSKRDLDTPTEILSVHDYENICAVNIAREAWGLRSWNGYCDIENWLHDGSVVRDRSRDTLTSGSSEISSCLSQELKNAILSAPSFPRKPHTYSNVFVKFERSSQEDYTNTMMCHSNDDTFLAKPCIIDLTKDPNHLEPILEELDDLGDIDVSCKKRLNSESSLVATIDEIRKATTTNSPRNPYYRREQWDSQWDSPQFHSDTTEISLKKAIWKEPYKFNSSNKMDSLQEKDIAIGSSHSSKFDSSKDLNVLPLSAKLNVNTAQNKNIPRRQKMNSTKNQNKKLNNKSEQVHDLSNKDIDFLWQLVSENSLPINTVDEFTLSRKTPSLQSLIQKDTTTNLVNATTAKISNIKKNGRTRPRRKFSILRERFEPKTNLHSDEEILYQCSENLSQNFDSNIMNVRNQFDAHSDSLNIKPPLKQSNELSNDVKCNSILESQTSSKNLKDKRSIFMKQVLSPPRFNTKLKHKV